MSTDTQILTAQHHFETARHQMDEVCNRILDRLFPCPYFWLGIDAEWPELVFV